MKKKITSSACCSECRHLRKKQQQKTGKLYEISYKYVAKLEHSDCQSQQIW